MFVTITFVILIFFFFFVSSSFGFALINDTCVDLSGIQFHILNRSKGPAVHVWNLLSIILFSFKLNVITSSSSSLFLYRDLELKSIENCIRKICKNVYLIILI